MSKKKKIHIGEVKSKPEDITKNRGHSYGAGRSTEAHGDKRKKRKRTRRAEKKEAMKGW